MCGIAGELRSDDQDPDLSILRTAMIALGIDASHGYERIHIHALHSVAPLIRACALS